MLQYKPFTEALVIKMSPFDQVMHLFIQIKMVTVFITSATLLPRRISSAGNSLPFNIQYLSLKIVFSRASSFIAIIDLIKRRFLNSTNI